MLFVFVVLGLTEEKRLLSLDYALVTLSLTLLMPLYSRERSHVLCAHIQSSQPLCFGCSLLHSTTLLCSWLYHYALPQKNKNYLFLIPCVHVGIRFSSNLFCVWGIGCATASQRSHFNQLSNRSVRFNSCPSASLPGEMTSVFNHFKSPCWSKKLKTSPWVINLVCFLKRTPRISRKSII